jgi:fluoride exporter
MLSTYLAVALGGALGSLGRFWLGNQVAALTGPAFPWGTLLINVIGSFVIAYFGSLTAASGRIAVPPDIRVFVMVGICGGFTTFSSFSLQTVELLRAGAPGRAAAYVIASAVLCLVFCAAGFWAAGAGALRG